MHKTNSIAEAHPQQEPARFPRLRSFDATQTLKRPVWKNFAAGIGLGVLLLLAGCQTPVGVKDVGSIQAYRELNADILSTGKLSPGTRYILHRYDLEERFSTQPRDVIAFLQKKAGEDGQRDLLYALSELSFAAAITDRTGASAREAKPGTAGRKGALDLRNNEVQARINPAAEPYYLSSAVYAYLYLFGDDKEKPPDAFDRRFRGACDLYNRGLSEALRIESSRNAALEPTVRPLVSGQLQIREATKDSFLTGLKLEGLIPADDYLVRGLSRRDRVSGIGAPMIATASSQSVSNQAGRFIGHRPVVPVTGLLRLDGGLADLNRGGLSGGLELHTGFGRIQARIGDQTVPLETDFTAALAYALEGAEVWKTELAQLLSSHQRIKTGLYMMGPYQPGKIPVVFVHGTASSPARWAEMFNTLGFDPAVQEHYQFWFFIYNTGNPVTYSAANLRDSIGDLVHIVDPAGEDAALKEMVVVGHSQGGLLCRILASTSGDHWGDVSRQSLDAMKLNPEDRQQVERCIFFEPSPYVRRVIFIATPHRGSYRVSNWVERLATGLMTLPGDLLEVSRNAIENGVGKGEEPLPAQLRKGVPTSISNMKPGSPFVQTLSALPISPNIEYHSIIAVKGDGPPADGNDGVVEYKSAYLDHAQSTFVVRSPHSCQNNPFTIEEVHRILLLHLKEMTTEKSASSAK